MRTVDEHARLVQELISPTDVIMLDLQRALGHVLAHDVTSPIDLPPFDNSAMDGYAARVADLAGLPATFTVSQEIPAGAATVGHLQPGTVARIMTGAPVPPGADHVVPVESTDGGVHHVEIREVDGGHAHIRPAGDDVRAGATVLAAGAEIGAAQLAVAAAVGCGSLPVYRPVSVLVLSTGSELAEPGTPLGPGQIYESNGQMLAAAVTQAGGSARMVHFVADDVAAFRTAVDRASDGVDLILTSGGVSAGAYEVVKDALSGAGVEFAKVAMQPGMPQGCGRLGDIPVVTLPGNPVSSFVSFEVFVRPAIRTAMHRPDPERPKLRLPLAESLDSPAGKRQFRRGVLDAVAGTVEPVGGAGSHLLGALAAADCLFVIPEGVGHVDAGTEVEVWLLA